MRIYRNHLPVRVHDSVPLEEWMKLPRLPLLASRDPLVNRFIAAMLKEKPAHFIYIGGSTPGASRTVQVSLVFKTEPEGRIYVAGYCNDRLSNRVFALDLIMVIK